MNISHKQYEMELELELAKIEKDLQAPDIRNEEGECDLDAQLAMWQMEKDRQRSIQQALQRLHNDQYGMCQGCYQPIDAERLKILPYTELCIACKRKNEGKTSRHNQPIDLRRAA